MWTEGLLLERMQIASLAPPVDLSGSANSATVGDWINAGKGQRFAFIFTKAVGTAGDDPTITVQQATDAAGTGAKALTFTTVYRKETTTSGGLKSESGTGQWTKTTQAAANTYTNLTSAESELIWVIDFAGAQLDADNGFKFVNATVADVGGNAQLGSLLCVVYDMRDASSPATMTDIRS